MEIAPSEPDRRTTGRPPAVRATRSNSSPARGAHGQSAVRTRSATTTAAAFSCTAPTPTAFCDFGRESEAYGEGLPVVTTDQRSSALPHPRDRHCREVRPAPRTSCA